MLCGDPCKWQQLPDADQHTFTIKSMKCVYRLEGAEWISQKGVWRMPMTHYSALLKALPAVPGVRLDVQPLPTVAQALVKVWQSLHRHQSAALTQIYARCNQKECMRAIVLAASRSCRSHVVYSQPIKGTYTASLHVLSALEIITQSITVAPPMHSLLKPFNPLATW